MIPLSQRQKKARSKIVHPTLVEAFDADWYYPFPPEEWEPEDREHPLLKKAIKEGWAEWIECQADIEAVKLGFVFDLSRDKNGRPVYWHKGGWVRYQGRGKSRRLVKIPIEKATPEEIPYVGRGDHACRFIECFLYHTKQPLEGKPYRLIHWQRKAMQTIFGWIRHTTDLSGNAARYRRHLRALLEVAKKNGKSELGSIVAIYLIRADYTLKAKVYGTAMEKKQARIVFDEARDFVKASPELSEDIFIHDSRVDAKLSHYESGSSYEVISADADSSDGFDGHGVIFDEIHRQKNRRLYATLQRSGQSRPQPLEFVTTTYGETYQSIWGELHLKCKKVLQERKQIIDQYVMIASAEPIQVIVTDNVDAGTELIPVQRLEQPIPEGEEVEIECSEGENVIVVLTKPARRFQRYLEVMPVGGPIPKYSEGEANDDPLNPSRLDHAIYRANPSLGITTTLDRIRSLINNASGPQEQAEAKRFNLNILAGGGNLWLSGAAWMACGRERVLPSSLLDRRCYGGLDISQSNDLTAFWLAFPNWKRGARFEKLEDPKVKLLGLIWVPGESIEAREKYEEIPYRAYAEKPYFAKYSAVRICDGPTIDYEMVGEDIIGLCNYFNVDAVAYDPYKSQFVVTPFLEPEGITCIPHRQGYVSMGPPSQRFENLVKQHRIAHGNHPLLDAAVEGCILKQADDAGNRHPSKKKSTSRIDPLIAGIMATGWCCDPPEDTDYGAPWSQEEDDTGKGRDEGAAVSRAGGIWGDEDDEEEDDFYE